VQDEASTHSNQAKYDLTDWVNFFPDDVPQQNNGSDCGMFTCKFADYLCENMDLHFSCLDVPYFRRRMVLELANSMVL
jgi:sentrin-specific protease 1